jgi:hypothetical protein
MKIKVGKRYIDGRGNIFEIVQENPEWKKFPFRADNGNTYNENGHYSYSTPDPRDLICEVNEVLYYLYIYKRIDKYQFLLRHYLGYGGDPCLINNKTDMK